MRDWPAMAWIGGAPGAGKSTIARSLARRTDLPLHPIDLWTYDHARRLNSSGSLDAELAAGPDHAAEAFVRSSENRLELIAADVRDRLLGDVSALVEGPQLFPSMAESVPVGVWLVPDAKQTRRAREERLGRVEDSAGRGRLEKLVARDAVLAERIRTEAAEYGRLLIEVPAQPDWSRISDQVAEAVGSLPRLSPGEPLSRQRRYENLAACRQGRLWQADLGLPELPPFPFACECGTAGCTEIWSSTPDEYDARPGYLVVH